MAKGATRTFYKYLWKCFSDFNWGYMLLSSGSYAFRRWELCFRTLRVMLSDSQSIAFRTPEHCFWNVGAMLLTVRSTSLDHTEQYSRCYGACLYIHTEHCPDGMEQCSDEYKDMCSCYYSTMTRPPMGWRVTRAWPFWSTFRVFFTGVGQ